ncbi:hypothetical protein LJC19_06390 [Oxalobacter sp. OttesenSCG-928-P03]|nr:hypothetical protein [Oxalobacter sp. OttesenSCG-928-P03]
MTMNTEQVLLEKYGPLLTMSVLAGMLNRTTDGLRWFLRGNCEMSQKLKAARLKVGRRVYFRTIDISRIIDGEDTSD